MSTNDWPKKEFPKKCLDPFFRGHLDIRKLLPMDLFDPGLYEMDEG